MTKNVLGVMAIAMVLLVGRDRGDVGNGRG